MEFRRNSGGWRGWGGRVQRRGRVHTARRRENELGAVATGEREAVAGANEIRVDEVSRLTVASRER